MRKLSKLQRTSDIKDIRCAKLCLLIFFAVGIFEAGFLVFAYQNGLSFPEIINTPRFSFNLLARMIEIFGLYPTMIFGVIASFALGIVGYVSNMYPCLFDDEREENTTV